MKAVAYQNPGAIDRATALQDVELDMPEPTSRDLLVAIEAISVNPVDTKIRKSAAAEPGKWKVLGWDAVGKVVSTGRQVSRFKPGDAVYYAGTVTRPGTNSEFHLVDERLAGHKPATLSNAEAAALPLTAITAWEMLFDRIDVKRPVPGAANAILIIGGAGGVGSIAIQIARALTDLTVIATASRPITQAWVKALGAHHVVDHSEPLAAQIDALGLGAPGFVFSTTHTQQYLDDIVTLIAPQGRFGMIDDPHNIDGMAYQSKSISIHTESMFARSLFQTADMDEQGRLLDAVAVLVDQGRIRSTLNEVLRPINAANLKKAHAILESGKAKGKIVLEGF